MSLSIMKVSVYVSVLMLANQTHNIGMRVEWAKAHARCQRWSEEVVILVEESRRVITYLDWKANWWLEQINLRTNAREDIQMGLSAYAHRQCALMQNLARSFASLWLPVLSKANLPADWPAEYVDYAQRNPRVLRTYGGRKKGAAKAARAAKEGLGMESELEEDDNEDQESDGLSEDDIDVSPYR